MKTTERTRAGMEIKCKLIRPGARLPTRGTQWAAGLDLYAAYDREIDPAVDTTIEFGVAVEIPSGWVGLLTIRSGLARDTGLTIVNSPGIIDSDYRGELAAVCRHPGLGRMTPSRPIIRAGDRVAQLVIVPCLTARAVQADELSLTDRGTGGWGSTGA